MRAFSFDNDGQEVGSPLDHLPLIFVVVLTFLLPLFFIPLSFFDFSITKHVLIGVFVLAAFCLLLFQRLKEGVLVFPKTYLFAAVPALLLVSAISAFFSGSFIPAFVGQGLEVGTVSFMATMTLLFLVVAAAFRSKEYIFYLYLTLLTAFVVVALYMVTRLVLGPETLSFGLFTTTVSNPLGAWNDLGIFFGIATLISLMTLEFLPLSRFLRVLFFAILALSLFLVGIVNFSTIWITLGIFSIVLFVYMMSFERARRGSPGGEMAGIGTKRLPVATLIVLVVSAAFLLANVPLSRLISSTFNISHVEARPSWQSTFSVGQGALSSNPLLGAGPNRFVSEWLLHKPDGINTTPFWDIDFTAGIGLLPTFVVTTGFVGALAWLVFLGIFLHLGFRALSPKEDRFAHYLVLSSFCVALYLWILCIFYVPGIVVIAFAFLFSGIFVAASVKEKLLPDKRIVFVDNPRSSFIASLLLIVILIGSIAGGYFYVQKFIASTYFGRGVMAFSEGSLEGARDFTERALEMSRSDLYYRFLTRVHLQRLNELLGKSDISADTARATFQEILGATIQSARSAVDFDASNYQNWVALGNVYGAVIPLKIDGAFEGAQDAYNHAIALNPHNPSLHLTLARFEAARGDIEAARGLIAEALKLKNNYTEAIFFLSQIQVSQGDLNAAISSVETASLIAPDDPAIFFQLGLLRYNKQDFTGTASALERAVLLNPSYSNARYFLGLAYDRLGRRSDAIAQFVEIEKLNADNREVKLILTNLRAGRSPFANADAPLNDTPQNRKDLPIEEE